MSWILQDLWHEIETRKREYEPDLATAKPKAYETLNRIASEVGQKWNVTIQLNVPPGSNITGVGHENISLLIDPGRKRFQGVGEAEIGNQLELLDPIKIEGIGLGYQGLKAYFSKGRIDCLPGGVHLWCTVTPGVLRLLDWLFANAYGIGPKQKEAVAGTS